MGQSRDRLSSIDLLPEDADEDITWAHAELKDRKRHKYEILAEFNSRLADRGIGPISKSAWSRHNITLAKAVRRLEEAREVASVIADRLQPGQTDELTIAVSETIKTLVFEMLQDGGRDGFSPKEAKEMAEAVRAAASAQNVSSDRRRKIEADLDKKVVETIDKVAKATGLSAERTTELRREFLGVRT